MKVLLILLFKKRKPRPEDFLSPYEKEKLEAKRARAKNDLLRFHLALIETRNRRKGREIYYSQLKNIK